MTNLLAARDQMAFTLGFHMIFAAFGVGFSLLMVVAEGIYLRTRTERYLALAKAWGKANAVLFGIGAVSGTALSFELGLLWPGFMRFAGSTIGTGFVAEGFAFFVEAIFIGLYLYGWNRLSPLAHWLTGIPIAIAGPASAVLVVGVDAWMQHPQGVQTLLKNPAAAATGPMLFGNPHWPLMALHATVSCYAATAFTLAAVYAWGMLKGRRDALRRSALHLAMMLGTAAAIAMPLTGDLSGKAVARYQPVKLAAMESQFTTQKAAPLRIGGWPNPKSRTVLAAIEIPGGLSWLAYGSAAATVRGLNAVPQTLWPNVQITHVSFQLMVAAGTALVVIALWYWLGVRRKTFPRPLLWAIAASGPLAFLALEAGWVVTEVGRQPWIVYGVQRTADAVTPIQGLWAYFSAFVVLYILLGTTVVWLLRRVEHSLPRAANAA
ncbi:MAG: cytochrome ubiquinol oxidase subunit I [Thermaerobacter sp.]|nr:cytochrome ubiquinol oxidase subunit I [Thermaerobacter sp.]